MTEETDKALDAEEAEFQGRPPEETAEPLAPMEPPPAHEHKPEFKPVDTPKAEFALPGPPGKMPEPVRTAESDAVEDASDAVLDKAHGKLVALGLTAGEVAAVLGLDTPQVRAAAKAARRAPPDNGNNDPKAVVAPSATVKVVTRP